MKGIHFLSQFSYFLGPNSAFCSKNLHTHNFCCLQSLRTKQQWGSEVTGTADVEAQTFLTMACNSRGFLVSFFIKCHFDNYPFILSFISQGSNLPLTPCVQRGSSLFFDNALKWVCNVPLRRGGNFLCHHLLRQECSFSKFCRFVRKLLHISSIHRSAIASHRPM